MNRNHGARKESSMEKYVFVGDIHGRVRDVERALTRPGKKIFVGDFVDSYTESAGKQQACLEMVLHSIKRAESQAVFGNHELSYMIPEHRCSGWNLETNLVIQKYKEEMYQLFKPYIFIEPNILVTHAGLSKFWWDKHDLTLDNLCDTLDDWWKDNASPMHKIGYTRGGQAPRGGTFWCHYPDEFEPIPDLVQIFGHTSDREIRGDGENFCIDNSRTQIGGMTFLEMEI